MEDHLACSRSVRLALLVVTAILVGCATPTQHPASPSAAGSCECGSSLDPRMGYAREPMVASDPTDPAHLVIAVQDAKRASGDAWDVALVSRDAGVTWTRADIPGGPSAGASHPLATAAATSDPTAAILRDGTVLYAGLSSHAARGTPAAFTAQGVTLFVARSSDGGLTYPDITTFPERPGATTFVYVPTFVDATVLQDDKEWMAVGPHDEVLLTWSDHIALPLRGQLVWSVSHDSGRTWTSAATIASGEGVYWGAAPVISPSGEWDVAYIAGTQDAQGYHYHLDVATSIDDGASWKTTVVDDNVTFQAPSLALTSDGLALAYSTGPDDAMAPTVRLRHGDAWSSPIAINSSALPLPGPQPAIAVKPDGRPVVVFWNGNETATTLRAATIDGNVISSVGDLGPGQVSGDYLGLAPTRGGVFAAWPRAQGGAPRLFGTIIP